MLLSNTEGNSASVDVNRHVWCDARLANPSARNLRCQWPRWSRVDILPISPETTPLRTKWLVHKDAVEGEDPALEKLTQVWQTTNVQDATFGRWQQVEKFLSWHIERMAAGARPN